MHIARILSLPPGGRGTAEAVKGARATSFYCEFHQGINDIVYITLCEIYFNEPAPLIYFSLILIDCSFFVFSSIESI